MVFSFINSSSTLFLNSLCSREPNDCTSLGPVRVNVFSCPLFFVQKREVFGSSVDVVSALTAGVRNVVAGCALCQIEGVGHTADKLSAVNAALGDKGEQGSVRILDRAKLFAKSASRR